MAHRLSNRDHRTFLAHDGRAPCRATSLVVLGPVLGLSGRFLSAASTPLTLPSTAKRCFTKCYPESRPTPLHSQQPFLTTTTGAKRTNSRATLSNALGCPSTSILKSLKRKDCWHPSTKIQAAHKSQLRGNHSLSAYIMLKGLNWIDLRWLFYYLTVQKDLYIDSGLDVDHIENRMWISHKRQNTPLNPRCHQPSYPLWPIIILSSCPASESQPEKCRIPTHHVVELHQLCQREALISEFDIMDAIARAAGEGMWDSVTWQFRVRKYFGPRKKSLGGASVGCPEGQAKFEGCSGEDLDLDALWVLSEFGLARMTIFLFIMMTAWRGLTIVSL